MWQELVIPRLAVEIRINVTAVRVNEVRTKLGSNDWMDLSQKVVISKTSRRPGFNASPLQLYH